jgi:exopolysaccharide biosynthesis protein
MGRATITFALLALCCASYARHHRHHRHHSPPPAAKPHHFADKGHPITYGEFNLGKARYLAVTANMADSDVRVSTVLSTGVSTVWKLVGKRQSACAAITGTFFCPSSGWPIADVVVDGALKVRGCRGSAIAVGYDGKPHIFDTAFGEKVDWSQYRWALRGVVRLVHKGHPSANPKWQRFHDSNIWGRVARAGVGITKAGKLVLMATTSPVTLTQFAKAMLRVGVREAVSLDGGSSTCLFYRGQVLIHPGRRLSNMLVLVENKTARS